MFPSFSSLNSVIDYKVENETEISKAHEFFPLFFFFGGGVLREGCPCFHSRWTTPQKTRLMLTPQAHNLVRKVVDKEVLTPQHWFPTFIESSYGLVVTAKITSLQEHKFQSCKTNQLIYVDGQKKT